MTRSDVITRLILVEKGVGRANVSPIRNKGNRVLVKDAYGQYLLIVVIVLPFLLFFCLLRPQRQEDDTNQKLLLPVHYQGGK